MDSYARTVPVGVLCFNRLHFGASWGFMRLGSVMRKILFPDRESLREGLTYLKSTNRITHRIEASALRLAANIPDMPDRTDNGITLEQFKATIELLLDVERLKTYHQAGVQTFNQQCPPSVWFRTFRIHGQSRRVALVGYRHQSISIWDSPTLVLNMAEFLRGTQPPNKSEWISLLQTAADPQLPLYPDRPLHQGPAVYQLDCEQQAGASPIVLVESQNHRRWIHVFDRADAAYCIETVLRPGRGICRTAKETQYVGEALAAIPLPEALPTVLHDVGETILICSQWAGLTVRCTVAVDAVRICARGK